MGFYGCQLPRPKCLAERVTAYCWREVDQRDCRGEGAQPRAKKTPKVKAPIKAEHWKRPTEKRTRRSIIPFFFGVDSPDNAGEPSWANEKRERTGSMISPMGLSIFISVKNYCMKIWSFCLVGQSWRRREKDCANQGKKDLKGVSHPGIKDALLFLGDLDMAGAWKF